MKILITGVARLIGSRLSDWIIENQPNVHIVGIDDMSGGYKENVNPKVELWEMNLVTGNIAECFEHSTAVFLILGNVCTRNCLYCNVSQGKPGFLNKSEPEDIAKSVKKFGGKRI